MSRDHTIDQKNIMTWEVGAPHYNSPLPSLIVLGLVEMEI